MRLSLACLPTPSVNRKPPPSGACLAHMWPNRQSRGCWLNFSLGSLLGVLPLGRIECTHLLPRSVSALTDGRCTPPSSSLAESQKRSAGPTPRKTAAGERAQMETLVLNAQGPIASRRVSSDSGSFNPIESLVAFSESFLGSREGSADAPRAKDSGGGASGRAGPERPNARLCANTGEQPHGMELLPQQRRNR